MKTITLEKALKLATPGPLTSQREDILGGDGMFLGSTRGKNYAANAALLAHFYNLGPELVAVVSEMLDRNKTLPQRYVTLKQARAILTKASTVQMP
jgi:hypothetical protein